MTLIEVLAVVCLIALAASVTLVGLGAADSRAKLSAALAECRSLDARARMLARGEGPVLISVIHEPHCIVARDADAATESAPLFRAEAPEGWSCHLLDIQGNDLPHVLVDARGDSDDYAIELRIEEAASGVAESHRLRVAGLTGWIEELAGP